MNGQIDKIAENTKNQNLVKYGMLKFQNVKELSVPNLNKKAGKTVLREKKNCRNLSVLPPYDFLLLVRK